MNLDSTVTAHPPQLTTPHSPPERDHTRLHPSLVLLDKEKEVQAKSCLNSVMNVEQNTLWKMQNSAVNVE